MRPLLRHVAYLGLLVGMQAVAQQPPAGDAAISAPTVPPTYRATSLTSVIVYLHHAEGRWSVSLDGDVKDPATEKVDITLNSGSAMALAPAPSKDSRLCLTKMKDRGEFGYLECNSAFYSANKGSAAASTLIRGILSLGILTVADAASGNTGVTVSLDQQALDAAVAESNAVEFARNAAPMIEYRQAFNNASSSQKLNDFIATYEGVFDPEMLVAKAKEKLPGVVDQESTRVWEKLAAEAKKAVDERRREAQRQADLEALRRYQAKLRPGDRVMAELAGNDLVQYVYGMVVEVKPPLAYLQWERVTPAMQWVRLDHLLPPR